MGQQYIVEARQLAVSTGASASAVACLEQRSVLIEIMRKSNIEEEICEDVADACELEDLNALVLASGILNTKQVAEKCYLTDGEAEILVQNCVHRAFHEGVTFGREEVSDPGRLETIRLPERSRNGSVAADAGEPAPVKGANYEEDSLKFADTPRPTVDEEAHTGEIPASLPENHSSPGDAEEGALPAEATKLSASSHGDEEEEEQDEGPRAPSEVVTGSAESEAVVVDEQFAFDNAQAVEAVSDPGEAVVTALVTEAFLEQQLQTAPAEVPAAPEDGAVVEEEFDEENSQEEEVEEAPLQGLASAGLPAVQEEAEDEVGAVVLEEEGAPREEQGEEFAEEDGDDKEDDAASKLREMALKNSSYKLSVGSAPSVNGALDDAPSATDTDAKQVSQAGSQRAVPQDWRTVSDRSLDVNTKMSIQTTDGALPSPEAPKTPPVPGRRAAAAAASSPYTSSPVTATSSFRRQGSSFDARGRSPSPRRGSRKSFPPSVGNASAGRHGPGSGADLDDLGGTFLKYPGEMPSFMRPTAAHEMRTKPAPPPEPPRVARAPARVPANATFVRPTASFAAKAEKEPVDPPKARSQYSSSPSGPRPVTVHVPFRLLTDMRVTSKPLLTTEELRVQELQQRMKAEAARRQAALDRLAAPCSAPPPKHRGPTKQKPFNLASVTLHEAELNARKQRIAASAAEEKRAREFKARPFDLAPLVDIGVRRVATHHPLTVPKAPNLRLNQGRQDQRAETNVRRGHDVHEAWRAQQAAEASERERRQVEEAERIRKENAFRARPTPDFSQVFRPKYNEIPVTKPKPFRLRTAAINGDKYYPSVPERGHGKVCSPHGAFSDFACSLRT